MRAVCPGSFDPITHGHLDVIRRAGGLFDEVIVAVGRNSAKNYLFTPDERVAMLTDAVKDLPGVQVLLLDGLLVDFCRDRGITAVVKGLRFGSDFDFEVQMAHMNRGLSGLETILLPAAREHLTLSSTILREVIKLGGDVTPYVPTNVAEAVARLRA